MNKQLFILKESPSDTNWGLDIWAIDKETDILYCGKHLFGTSEWRYSQYKIGGLVHKVENDTIIREDGRETPVSSWDGKDGGLLYGRPVVRVNEYRNVILED